MLTAIDKTDVAFTSVHLHRWHDTFAHPVRASIPEVGLAKCNRLHHVFRVGLKSERIGSVSYIMWYTLC